MTLDVIPKVQFRRMRALCDGGASINDVGEALVRLRDEFPTLKEWVVADLESEIEEVESQDNCETLGLVSRHKLRRSSAVDVALKKTRNTLSLVTMKDVTLVCAKRGFAIFRKSAISRLTAGLPNFSPDAAEPSSRFDFGFFAGDLFGDNICHNLFDVIGRAHLAETVLGLRPEQIFMAETGSPYLKRARQLCTPRARELPRHTAFHFGTLQFFGASVGPNDHPAHRADPRIIGHIRRSHGVEGGVAPAGGPRIYLSRRDARTRMLENEAAVVETLAGRGFEEVLMGELPPSEQVRIAAEASAVAGPHGAALTNIVFCAPGAPVFEFFNPEAGTTAYFQIARSVGLDYRTVFGAPTGVRRNWRIELTEVERAMDQAGLAPV